VSVPSEHDPLCPLSIFPDVPSYLVQPGDCRCDLIGRVRSDMRRQIVAAIEELLGPNPHGGYAEGVRDSAAIAGHA
jgi:hypothetical protein